MENQQLDQTNLAICIKCGCTGSGCVCKESFDAPADPWIGQRINDQYEIVSLIARGGMGAVYKARHLLLNTFRAIKVLRTDLHCDEIAYQRFKQEAQAVMGLSHPNIVTFHEFGLLTTTPYVVMDLIEGRALDAVLKQEGKLEKTKALEVFIQVAAAMAHAHSKGIYHRDLKPSNIMLTEGEDGHAVVKVLDFGIAKIQSDDGQKLTGTGEIFGSPMYMSPEQGRGQSVDARSDIYSLGCVIFESLAGKPPFQGTNAIETIMKHLNEKPERIFNIKKTRSFDPVLLDFEAVVSRCLEKEPDKRYATMAALEADLRSLSYGERLLSLQRDISLKRRIKLAEKIHKWVLIVLALCVPLYAVYSVFVDPDTCQNKLRSALHYQDTADSVIQQLIADLSAENKKTPLAILAPQWNSEWNLAYLLWNQAQIYRMKSLGEPALLQRAIDTYNTSLIHLDKDLSSGQLGSATKADCYEGLCRAYLQKAATDSSAALLARTNAENALAIRRRLLEQQGTNEISIDNLGQALSLLARAKAALKDDPKGIDEILSEEEKQLRLYAPGSWLMAECLISQAENDLRLGLTSEAIQKLKEALPIQASIYGIRSPEVKSLRSRIRALH